MRLFVLIAMNAAVTYVAATSMRSSDRVGRLGYHLGYLGGILCSSALISYGNEPIQLDVLWICGFVIMICGFGIGLFRHVQLERRAARDGAARVNP